MEVRRTDTFSDDVPVIPTRSQRHFLLARDVFELATYFTNLKRKIKKALDNVFCLQGSPVNRSGYCHR